MREVDEDAVGVRGEFVGERNEIAAMDFDSWVEGIERVGLGEDQGGGSRPRDGRRSEWKQHGGRVVGDQQNALTFSAFFNRCAARSDQIDHHAGCEDRITREIG